MILRIKNAAKIDWIITLVPLALIVILCSIFLLFQLLPMMY